MGPQLVLALSQALAPVALPCPCWPAASTRRLPPPRAATPASEAHLRPGSRGSTGEEGPRPADL